MKTSQLLRKTLDLLVKNVGNLFEAVRSIESRSEQIIWHPPVSGLFPGSTHFDFELEEDAARPRELQRLPAVAAPKRAPEAPRRRARVARRRAPIRNGAAHGPHCHI